MTRRIVLLLTVVLALTSACDQLLGPPTDDNPDDDPGDEQPIEDEPGNDEATWDDLLLPEDGASDMPLSVDLSWSEHPEFGDYTILLDTGTPPVTAAGSTTSTKFVAEALSYATEYFWQVVAGNGSETESSAIRSFTTIAAPAWAGLLAPFNGMQELGTTVTLEWAELDSATDYTVLLDTTDPPAAELGTTSSTSLAASGLAHDTTYFWAVRANDPAGDQTTTARSFTTAADEIIVYVSTLGSSEGSGSREDPLDSVADGIDAAVALADSPGDPVTVKVAEGTYDEQIFLDDGVSLFGGYDEATWQRDRSAHVTLLLNSAGAHTVNASADALIDGFTIRTYPAGGAPTESYEYAISISGADPTISNNIIVGGALGQQSRTVHIQSTANPTITGNTIIGSDYAATNSAVAISTAGSLSGTVTLSDNVIEAGVGTYATFALLFYSDNALIESSGNVYRVTDGTTTYGSFLADLSGAAPGTRFDGDTFELTLADSGDAPLFKLGGVPLAVTNSVFSLDRGSGAVEIITGSGTSDVQFINNSVVVTGEPTGTNALIDVHSSGWTIVNNIFHIDEGGSGSLDFIADGGYSPTVSHNFFYRNGEDLSGSTPGTNAVTSTDIDYLALADRNGGNLRLTASTPATITDGGTNTSGDGVTEDFDGTARTDGNYSIGAFEDQP